MMRFLNFTTLLLLSICGVFAAPQQFQQVNSYSNNADHQLNALVSVLDRNVDARIELLLHLLQIWRSARYSNGQNHRLFPNFPISDQFPGSYPQNQNSGSNGILGPFPNNPKNQISGPFPHNPNNQISGPFPHNPNNQISGPFPHNPNNQISGPFPHNPNNQGSSGSPNQILGPFPNTPNNKNSNGPLSGSLPDHHDHGQDDEDSHEEYEGLEADEDNIVGADPEHTPGEVFKEGFKKNVLQTDKEPIVPIVGHDH